MKHDEDFKEVMARRGKKEFQSFIPLHEADVSQPEPMAKMTQPKDQEQYQDPMKETGPGYETEKGTTLSEEEGRTPLHEYLGSENARNSLRGRATEESKKKVGAK